jgi:hypothetical protein
MTIIRLADGTPFDYDSPNLDTLTKDVLVGSLSKICRFTGHTSSFYSVAQHSILVSHIVHPSLALPALLHDCGEAFIGDINSPLKRWIAEHTRDDSLKMLEHQIQLLVFQRFCVAWPDNFGWDKIKTADLLAYQLEKKFFMTVTVPIDEHASFDPPVVDLKLFDTLITKLGINYSWNDSSAYTQFIARWQELERPC